MRASLKTLQRLRKIREDQAASKLRAAQAAQAHAQSGLAQIQQEQERARNAKPELAAAARSVGKEMLNLEMKARRQQETLRRATVAADARKALLQLRSRELSSLEKLQELLEQEAAEEARKAEAKELDELGRRLLQRKAA